jgi:hypothetical protein
MHTWKMTHFRQITNSYILILCFFNHESNYRFIKSYLSLNIDIIIKDIELLTTSIFLS